ncbi:MAG: response regulator, partial [Nitrospinaceae bacterium]|nr:response regulator [Nitrospinaceae bacterium]NIR54709.1 response regulator [Nitrospinaceae bacterium]NIS85130.1 response regulator [Nitrospinaceae bacterium]NIT81947.1 response regulator [Nitrospinaceae bacterium]NIU44208.1 response regulator [Nitrospinaceae bacterium]
MDLDPIPFNLEELVQDSVNAFRLTAQDKGIGLKVHMDESIPKPLVGDLRRLEQILISLVNNAIKFTYEGEVQIQVRHGGEDGPQCIVHFLVMDSGIGFPEDRKELIFERMAQGDPDIERNYGGTGLGLYVCKCLVELMGGKIWAENRESGGATFGFSLPFEMGSVEDLKEELIFTPREKPENESPADADEKGDGLSREPEDNGASGYSEGESMNILVVDDCEDTRKLIGKFMEDIPCQIYFAGNGLEALEKHDEHQYDLILMDIQMPEMDGVGATIEIRKKEVAKKVGKTPIIAMVGNPGVQDEGYYLAADFDRCLIKPVSKADL